MFLKLITCDVFNLYATFICQAVKIVALELG